MLGPKCGLFISSLQQTDLLKDFGSTGSGRRVQLMPLPVLDTALVHADALADLALDPTLSLPLPEALPRVPA